MNKTMPMIVLVCILVPVELSAMGVNDAEVKLHNSPQIAGDLDELGYLDVTEGLDGNPGADNTGAVDSADAIQRAITKAYANNMVVYFPSGRYLVTKKIECRQMLYFNDQSGDYRSQLRHAHVLVGSTLGEGVTIRLADSALWFNNPNSPRSLFQFWCTDQEHPTDQDTDHTDPTRHYNAEMRNLKIDLGTGNSGAIAIWMQGAQGCNIQDVDININEGFAGLANLVGTGSGHAKVTLRNGKYGIWCEKDYMGFTKSSQPMPYLAGFRFLNQRESAVYSNEINGTLTIIGFKIDMTNVDNKKAIVLANSYGDTSDSLNLVDGTIEMKGASSIAVANDGKKSVNMENVYIKAEKLVDCADDDGDYGGSQTAWKKVVNYSYIGQDEVSGDPFHNPAVSYANGVLVPANQKMRATVGDFSPSSVDHEKLVAMHLWKCDFPTFEDKDCYIADELDGTGAGDVTVALQGLIDAHDKVFLPKGLYKISGKISLGRDKKLFGIAKNLSILKMDPDKLDPDSENPLYMVETADNAGSQNMVAFLEFQQNFHQRNIASLHWRAGRQSVIRNIQQWYAADGVKYRYHADFLFSGNGGGKLYNFHHTCNLRSDNSDYRPAGLRFDGVAEPTYVYGLSSESARADGQLDILNSQNVNIISYKDENTGEVDYSDPQNQLHIKTIIKGSSNIGIYGMKNMIFRHNSADDPADLDVFPTVVSDSSNIAICSAARSVGQAATDPTKCNLFYQDADGNGIPELSLHAKNAFSKYELGAYARDIAGSAIWNLVPLDTFTASVKNHWCGPYGFTWDASEGGRGRLASGKLDYLGSANYDHVKIFYDFEDVTSAAGSAPNWQVLRAKIRAQQDLEDCYEVRLERKGRLRILAKAFSGSLVSVADIPTGLADIQGATHHMEILVKDEPDGDIRISVKFDTTGTANDKTLTWTHPADDTYYKRFRKGTIGFLSASSVNFVDNFVVKDGLFYND